MAWDCGDGDDDGRDIMVGEEDEEMKKPKKENKIIPTAIYTFVCPKCWTGIEFEVYGDHQYGQFRMLKKKK